MCYLSVVLAEFGCWEVLGKDQGIGNPGLAVIRIISVMKAQASCVGASLLQQWWIIN